MRWIGWVVLALAVLTAGGCPWAKFSEFHDGPRAAVTKGSPAATDGRYRYVPVGTGTWVDAAGKTRTECVYVRVDGK